MTTQGRNSVHQSAGSSHGLALFSALAAILIGHALQVSVEVQGKPLPWLCGGILVAALGLFVRIGASREHGAALFVCVLGILWQIQGIMAHFPLRGALDPYVPFYFYSVSLPLLGAFALATVLIQSASRKVFLPLMLAAHFATGIWLLKRTPPPFIDVYEAGTQACQRLAAGANPYSGDFPDIYLRIRPDFRPPYPPGFVVNGRVKEGYFYMPETLAVNFAGYVLGGDLRFGNLLALTLAGGLIAYCRRGPLAPAAASLLLLTHAGFDVIRQGWVEPCVICGLAFVVFLACRRSRLLPYTVGLLLVSKQYMLLATPLVGLLGPWPWQNKAGRSFWLKIAVTSAAATLPLIIVNPVAFYHSVVAFQLAGPFRLDSLNLSAAWVRSGHLPPPTYLGFLAALAIVPASLRAGRSPAAFAAMVAVVFLFFFIVARQAFVNYYFFTIGALCCAVAATETRSEQV